MDLLRLDPRSIRLLMVNLANRLSWMRATSSNLMNLNEGTNEIYLQAIDVAENQSQRSALISLFVDLQPPVIGNPVPGDGQRTQSKLLEMKVELADNPGGSGIDTDSLQFVLDGNQPLWEFVYQAEDGF